MVEDNGEKKKEPFEIKFVESFDKEDEDKLAAFLGKVTGQLAKGDESVPTGVDSQLQDWIGQLQAGNFTIGQDTTATVTEVTEEKPESAPKEAEFDHPDID